MTSRRKSSRSLSLRTSSFIRLIRPFRPRSVHVPRTERGALPDRLQPAVSDPQINMSASKEKGRILDAAGRIITQAPDRDSDDVEYVTSPQVIQCAASSGVKPAPNLNYSPQLGHPNYSVKPGYIGNPLILEPPEPIYSATKVFNTATLGQNVTSTGKRSLSPLLQRAGSVAAGRADSIRPLWGGGGGTLRRGLLGRSAVSYQNLSPSAGELFSPVGEVAGRDTRNGSVDRPPAAPSTALCRSFAAQGNRSTTNVAWLVGATTKPQPQEHHIDILDSHIQPPSHLEVAPLVQMGYSLARSKTVSDIPLWAQEAVNPPPAPQSVAAAEPGLAAATPHTTGSLRSKVVKHRTLLGSSSRLYKFSQSLSSLTTLGSESRTSTWDRALPANTR